MPKQNDAYMEPVHTAQLEWRAGQPYCLQFDDIYFSKANGLQESQYVFLEQNNLLARWRTLGNKVFIIAETGFGTGLNFLTACQQWFSAAPADAVLHYYAVEKHPLMKSDLSRALSLFPTLHDLPKHLLEAYPALTPGLHRISLFNGRVQLTLGFMDIGTWLQNIDIQADAWFLDGFAPAKNQLMWSEEILTTIGKHTKSGGSVSTFTAASAVRRGLQAAGFVVNKVKGFAGKREMLCGHYPVNCEPKKYTAAQNPWFLRQTQRSTQKTVTVIGAGLAGVFTAVSLAKRGHYVTVIERQAEPALEASGNPLAVIFSKLSAYPDLAYRFYQDSYLYALRTLPDLLRGSDAFYPCPVLQLELDKKEQRRQQQVVESQIWPAEIVEVINSQQASALAGVHIEQAGLFFKEAGCIAPKLACQYLLNQQPNIRLLCNREAMQLQRQDDAWLITDLDNNVIQQSQTVVIANALDATRFSQSNYLPLIPVRGQVTQLPATDYSTSLSAILCYEGYITPAWHAQHHSLGATYDARDMEAKVRAEDDGRNLTQLKMALPDLASHFEINNVQAGRVAWRCCTPDYLPFVGPLPNVNAFKKDYACLRSGFLHAQVPAGHYLPDLYINIAYGSRGVTLAPYCAEIIAAYIAHEPMPIDEPLRTAVHPARIPIKQLKRNEL